MLRTLVDDHVSDWEDCLDFAVFAYNSSTHPTLGYSPFFMNFGQEPTIPLNSILGKQVEDLNIETYVQQRLDQLNQSIKEGREAQEKAKCKAHQTLSEQASNSQNPSFKIGDHVFIDSPSAKKLENQWEGPFEITNISGTTATVNYYSSLKKFHLSQLKTSKIEHQDLNVETPSDPAEETEVEPDLDMDPKELIGK